MSAETTSINNEVAVYMDAFFEKGQIEPQWGLGQNPATKCFPQILIARIASLDICICKEYLPQ